MRVARDLLAWAGLDVPEAMAFGLGLGFAVSLDRGKLSDCLPEHAIILNLARGLSMECEEFGTVAPSKALDHLRERLGRGVPVAARLSGGMGLFTSLGERGPVLDGREIPWDDAEKRLFFGQGPFKAFLYTYRKTRHFPPLGVAVKKALSATARRFIFPDKPHRGAKIVRLLSGEMSWAHEPAMGHALFADFLDEAGYPEESGFFKEASQAWKTMGPDRAREQLLLEKDILSRFL